MNYNIRTILVPLDLSETSLNALDTAVALASKNSADLFLLYVAEHAFSRYHASHHLPENTVLMHSDDVLTALTGSIEHNYSVPVELLRREGHVVEHILDAALAINADLIVMGSNGAAGYRNGFTGTNTYGVMKHAACPVLSIPPKRKYLSFHKILFPVRPVSGALNRYDVVCHFLEDMTKVDVLGISYRPTERNTNVLDRLVDEVKERFEIESGRFHTSWSSGQLIADDVLLHAQQTLPDLIVTTPLLDIADKQEFIGPHGQKIINGSKIPVLGIKGIEAFAHHKNSLPL